MGEISNSQKNDGSWYVTSPATGKLILIFQNRNHSLLGNCVINTIK